MGDLFDWREICILVVIFAILYYLLKPVCTNIETFRFDSGVAGPHILLVGSVHGNEPAASVAFKQLADELRDGAKVLQKGRITILPSCNPCGKAVSMRWLPHQLLLFHAIDLNRNFAKKPNQRGRCTISRMIEDLAREADLVIDGHEGYDFVKRNPKSMGSAVYAGRSELAEKMVAKMVDDLNKTITNKPTSCKGFFCNPLKSLTNNKIDKMTVEDFHFIVNIEPDLPGTLRWFCDGNRVPYILIETTGQADIQPLNVRANQHKILVTSALQQLGMI